MSKREDLVRQLRPLLAADSPPAALERFLLEGSNLPGPRGNLELAEAFGDSFASSTPEDLLDRHGDLLWRWAALPAADTPAGPPWEFLPFCALQALAATFPLGDERWRTRVTGALQAAASDQRWRVREAVAMGFQRIAEWDPGVACRLHAEWLPTAGWFEKRAILAALAHPPILDDPATVALGFAVAAAALADVRAADAATRRSQGFRVLRQGLEYAVSLFVAQEPERGFAFLREWAGQGDPDVTRVVRSNLGKARLAKRYPTEVAEMLAALPPSRPRTAPG